MTKEILDHQLQIDKDKYLISKRLFNEIYAETNYLGDYDKCRSYVRATMCICMSEIQEVNNFKTKKIDIQL